MIAVTESGVVLSDRPVSERARLLALALELRAGLVALGKAARTDEAALPWEQSAKCCEYVVKRLEDAL